MIMHRTVFEIGDRVIVAKDFDNTTKTEKLLPSLFNDVKTTEFLSHNRVKVETGDGAQI